MLKSKFSGLHAVTDKYGSIVIGSAVDVSSQICEIPRNSQEIPLFDAP